MKSWIAILVLGLVICGMIILKTQQIERRLLLRGMPGKVTNAAYDASGQINVEPPAEYETPKSALEPSWSISPVSKYLESSY